MIFNLFVFNNFIGEQTRGFIMFPINFLYCWIRSFRAFHAFLPVCTLLNLISIIAPAVVNFCHTWRLGNAYIRTQSCVCQEVGSVGVCLWEMPFGIYKQQLSLTFKEKRTLCNCIIYHSAACEGE